ncbi:MAG: alpha/beta hydrolase family protein, partial [Bryobacteraceae bacterium]
PGTPPRKNRAFALDMVEAGFVAVAPDFLRDGERVLPGRKPYDTTDFYNKHPNWSIHGKDAWDTSRIIDWLESLPYVNAKQIGIIGHSYGGHTSIFAAAHEPRIAVVVANGPVSDFYHHGMHWAVGPGESRSQSLPAMRPYLVRRERPPLAFYEVTSMIAPRPLLVGEAAGERRPMEEENCAAVHQVYRALSASERVRYLWYAGDHDFPPAARQAAVEWFRRWFSTGERKTDR